MRGFLTFLLGKPPVPEFLERVSCRNEGSFGELIRVNLELLPGALQWLCHLWKLGIPQSLASSAPNEYIDAISDGLTLRQHFSALISACAMPGKPKPAVFLEAARQLGAEHGQCVVVEDAAGVAAAWQSA